MTLTYRLCQIGTIVLKWHNRFCKNVLVSIFMKIKPKKSLGQNFLNNKAVIDKIIQAADLTPDDFVLEIGPGKGILTEELAKAAGKVVAVEIDGSLVELLRNKFSSTKNVEIISGDILKTDLNKLVSGYKLQATGYRVIANLPYYITSPIIRLFLESEFPPQEMILMVQKEVAERIAAKAGQMSILAVSVQYYADIKILFDVGKENFDPIPEVDSAVIHVTHNMKHETRDKKYNQNFFRVVRAGFSAKRKTLVNNLSNSLHLDKNAVEEKIKTIPLSGIVRAQELSVEDWKKLVNLFEKI